jgi:hypothetical protein
MQQHGHSLTHLKTDDEAVYKTPIMKQLYAKFLSSATHSSPDIHQWNGLAEASNRKSGNMVTSMLACARHLSEVFWSKAWEQADLIHSLGPCSIKGKEHMTRFEAVRKVKPDLNAIVMLPFGQPMEFHIPKDQRGRFFEKTRRGSYIGASLDHPGSIQVWSHSTRKKITTGSFRVLHSLPNPELQHDRTMFRDSDDVGDETEYDLRTATEIPGAVTRQRSSEISKEQQNDSITNLSSEVALTVSSESDEHDMFVEDGQQTNAAVIPVNTSASNQSDNGPTATPPSAATHQIPTIVQEGDVVSAPAQEGGMITRSRSATPTAPQVITTISALRKSMRAGNKVVNYCDDLPKHVNHNIITYRSLAFSAHKRRITCVAIAPSTLKESGHGLFATKDLLEGTYPCSYGQCFGDDTTHSDHNDTMYHDGEHLSIGNRDKDYGCWCNDPLDQALVNCTIVHDNAKNQHILRIRWDVIAGEELFLDYGIEFWQEHYWRNPTAVRKRYPDIVPTHPAPAEGESLPYRSILSVDILKYPKSFEKAKTIPWTAPEDKKRRSAQSSEGAKRVARILCSRYAMERLTSMSEIDAQGDDIQYNIRKLNEQIQPAIKGRKRAKVQFKDDLDRMAELKKKQKKCQKTKSRRGLSVTKGTRDAWELTEESIL